MQSRLNRYHFERLLDDIKLIARSVRVTADENNPNNKHRALQLTEDLINRLYRDLREVYDVLPEDDKIGFGGYINVNKDGNVEEKKND